MFGYKCTNKTAKVGQKKNYKGSFRRKFTDTWFH